MEARYFIFFGVGEEGVRYRMRQPRGIRLRRCASCAPKTKPFTLEPVPHSGGLRPPRAREVWSSPQWQCCKSSKEEAHCTGRCASQHATAIACATLVRHVSSSKAIRGVLGRWPKHSQTLWSPLTNDRQLPEQRPQVAPVHEGQGVLGRCVLSASVLPGEPRHHACPLAACHCGATHTPYLQSGSIQSIRRWDVHVTDHQGCAHSSTSISADACHDAFECISSSTKHSRLRTCCSMVATRIKWMATSAAACREREDLAWATKHHHSEQVARDGRLPGGRCHNEGRTSSRA